MKRVYLAGEGANEIDRFVRESPYRDDYGPGVVEALLQRAVPGGFQVVGGVQWSKVAKLRTRQRLGRGDLNTVRKLALMARRAGADVLVFVRDWDMVGRRGQPLARSRALAEMQDAARALGVEVAGAFAVKNLDAWCLALRGELGSESERQPKATLKAAGASTTPEKVAIVEAADLDHLPADAHSLRAWLADVRTALT